MLNNDSIIYIGTHLSVQYIIPFMDNAARTRRMLVIQHDCVTTIIKKININK